VCLVSLGNVHASPVDNSKPIEIVSEELVINMDSGTALFSGDVTVVQGEFILDAQTVLIEYLITEGKLTGIMKKIIATTDVVFQSENQNATADKVVFDLLLETINMNGNVHLIDREREDKI
tara:strand:+ start:446 stop:808 length:363 start_codon:yes stop_codon:yes gene_type:complete